MNSLIDEIKSKLNIVDVISEYVQLKPAGKDFKGLCPFHHEKTPSFFVSPDKEVWHCFGCGAGGSIFDFVMQIDGVDFPEALRILAQKAGIDTKKYKKYGSHFVSQNTKLLDIVSIAAKFYHEILLKSSLSKEARQYLKKRKLTDKTISEFQIGFAPNKWDTLLKFLIKRGYQKKAIELSGLIIQKSGTQHYYDRFRNRIMFPITNVHGQVVGFTGRILPNSTKQDTKEVAKYVNTPETAIYNKSKILYGLDKAKLEVKLKNLLILVEGQMDMISSFQAGIKNVVCISGTALTLEHLKLISRYTKNVILSFDIDMAGQKATQRGIDLLLEQNFNVKVVHLPEGKDPDECIKKDPKIWRKALEQTLPIMDYYFSLYFKNKDLNKIEDKKEIAHQLLPIINKLADPVEKDLWLNKLAKKLSVKEEALYDAIEKIKLPAYRNIKEKIIERPSQIQLAGERFVGLILQHPQYAPNFLEKTTLDMFTSSKLQDLVRAIKKCYSENKELKIDYLKKKYDDFFYINHLIFLVKKEFESYSKEDIEKEIGNFYYILKKKYLVRELKDATVKLKKAEENKDEDSIKKITIHIANLSKNISKLE